MKPRPPSVTVTLKRNLRTRLSAARFLRESLNVTVTFASSGVVNDLDATRSLRLLAPTLTDLVLASPIVPLVRGVAANL